MSNLPKGWRVETLQSFCDDLKSSIVDGPFGSNLKRSDYKTKGIPVLKIQNIKPFKIIIKKMDYVSKDKYDELIRHSYQAGDIIITKLGEPLGLSAIVPPEFEKGLIVADLVRVRINTKKINLKYLCYVLNSPRTSNYINSKQKGTTRARVKLSIVRELPIPYVNLETQEIIVSEIEKQFTRLNAVVKDLNSVKAKLGVYRKSVLKAAFDIGCDYDSLGEILNTTSGGTPSRANKSFYQGDIPWLKSGELSDNMNISDSEEHITEEAVKNSSAKKFPKNTVLIAMYGATTGKIGIIRSECTTNQAVCGITPSEDYFPEFIFYYLLNKRQYLIDQGKGGAQPNISQGIIKSTPFPLSSKDKQKTIIQEIESRFSIIDKLEQSVDSALSKTELLRKSILKTAFEGKLVKNE